MISRTRALIVIGLAAQPCVEGIVVRAGTRARMSMSASISRTLRECCSAPERRSRPTRPAVSARRCGCGSASTASEASTSVRALRT